MPRHLMEFVRFGPYTVAELCRQVEAWGVWGVKRQRGTLTLAIFSPDSKFIEVLAAKNGRKVYHYNTEQNGERWAVGFSCLKLAYIAARALRHACAAHQTLFSKIVAVRDLNDQIGRLASHRARYRRAAVRAERDYLLNEIANLRKAANAACPVRRGARLEAATAIAPSGQLDWHKPAAPSAGVHRGRDRREVPILSH